VTDSVKYLMFMGIVFVEIAVLVIHVFYGIGALGMIGRIKMGWGRKRCSGVPSPV
jgi:hypothetical protein